ncbi:hypothetical protein [Paenibacillus tianjinensis]|uniref:Uncharacterized protein n=1 Tax=Paenibacillus tianjinensis TaxID=2810347 RepID=A0ABX7LAT8_9BACL|nr:hypothetical protein [Paenibacillus tianjinensis]QSF45036.1 hypothetical protein JRJ22_28545 [Paenibacillus tianjinensis]
MYGRPFGRGMTIAYFQQHTARLFIAGDNLDCRYARTYLKQNGITATQYMQNNLSTLYEAAEELAAMGNERIALYVTAANYRLCRSLTEAVKGMDEGIRIVWFGDGLGMNGIRLPAGTAADGLILWEPEQTLLHLAKADDGWEEAVEGFIPASRFTDWSGAAGKAVSQLDGEGSADTRLDRLNGIWEEALKQRWPVISSIKCADRNGYGHNIRTHSKERFSEDLNLALQQLGPERQLSLEGFHYLAGKRGRAAICEALEASRQLTAGYSAEIPLEWLLEQSEYTRLLQAGIIQIIIRIPLTMNKLQYNEAFQLTEILKRTSAGVKLAAVLIDETTDLLEDEAENTAALLTHWVNEGLLQAGDVQLDTAGLAPDEHKVPVPESIAAFLQRNLRQEEEQALINGFMAYMTGQYPHQVLGSGVKHIGYPEGEWNQATVQGLAEYSAINSAILFEYNPVRVPSSTNTIYAGPEGVWKRENEAYLEWERQSEQNSYYLSNAHQINRLGECEYELQLNDFLHMEPLEIRQLQYSRAQEMNVAPSGREPRFQLLNLESAEDMDRFLEDVELFSKSGMFRYAYEIQADLMESCRWSGVHSCTARQLPRIFIDGDDRISPCRGCAVIGRVGDSLDQLLTQVSVVSEEEQLLRGCRTCEIKDSCSKCSFLPEYLNRQQYCELRKKHKLLHRYMQMVQVFKGLSKYARSLQNIEVHELRVSLPACTHLWKQPEPHRPVSTAVLETVFLFFIGDQPMLFHAGSQKLMKLNEPMALMLEGLMSGAERTELEQELMARYQLDGEFAARLVTQALGLFAKEGCLMQAARAV